MIKDNVSLGIRISEYICYGYIPGNTYVVYIESNILRIIPGRIYSEREQEPERMAGVHTDPETGAEAETGLDT